MATLKIELDDSATEGLKELSTQIDATAKATDNMADSAKQMTIVQQNQLTVIQASKQGWSEFGQTTMNVLGDVAKEAIDCFKELELAPFRLGETAIKEGATLAKWAIVSTAAVIGVKAVWGKNTRAIKASGEEQERFLGMSGTAMSKLAALGIVATDTATGYTTLGKTAEFAGRRVLGSLTGMGPQLAVVAAGWEGYRMVLARTGVETERLADGTTVLSTNLDRVQGSIDNFGAVVKRDFGEAAAAAKALFEMPSIDLGIWKEFDKVVTQGAKNLVSNIDMTRTAYSEGVISLRAFAVQMTGGNADAYRKEIANVRELQGWHEKMDRQREIEAEGFKNLGSANRTLQHEEETRAEKARLAAINTIDGLNNEIEATRSAAVMKAQAGQFDAKATEEYFQKMNALEQRRGEITKSVEKERREQIKASQKAREEAIDAEQSKLDEYMHRMQEVFDLEYKRGQERAKQNRELAATGFGESMATGLDAAKQFHEGDKDAATARLKANGATELEIKTQLAEMDKRFGADVHALKMQQIAEEYKVQRANFEKQKDEIEKAGLGEIEREKRLAKVKIEEDKALFDARKKALLETGEFERQQNALNFAQQMSQKQAAWAAEEERANRLKAMEQSTIQKGFNAQDFLNMTDQNKVKKQLQDDRAAKAGQAQGMKDIELWKKGSQGDKAAAAKFIRNQKTAMAKARRSVSRDIDRGGISNGEMVQAQQKVGQQSVAALQKQGKLTDTVAQAVSENTQALAGVLKIEWSEQSVYIPFLFPLKANLRCD